VLPQLSGSARQTAWATRIHTERLLALLKEVAEHHAEACTDCFQQQRQNGGSITAACLNAQGSPSLKDIKAVAVPMSGKWPAIRVGSST
jgi:hypothetical protein